MKIFLGLTCLLPLILANSSCESGGKPDWDVEFYAGDSVRGGIARCLKWNEAGDHCLHWDVIKAGDLRINNYVCQTYDAVEKLYEDVISQCREWK